LRRGRHVAIDNRLSVANLGEGGKLHVSSIL
jgi:hypothetical protein